MVRLKAEGSSASPLNFVKNFNSTMVRLKDSSVAAVACSVTIFQFHYGSIKRGGMPPFITFIKDDFNSTMVRLKAKNLRKM